MTATDTRTVADEATPPRPLGEHGCCGARIYRAGWRSL